MDREGIGQSPLGEAEADLEDTQITTVVAIDKMTQALVDGVATD